MVPFAPLPQLHQHLLHFGVLRLDGALGLDLGQFKLFFQQLRFDFANLVLTLDFPLVQLLQRLTDVLLEFLLALSLFFDALDLKVQFFGALKVVILALELAEVLCEEGLLLNLRLHLRLQFAGLALNLCVLHLQLGFDFHVVFTLGVFGCQVWVGPDPFFKPTYLFE